MGEAMPNILISFFVLFHCGDDKDWCSNLIIEYNEPLEAYSITILNTLFDSASSKVVSCMSGVIFLIAKSDLKYIAHMFKTLCDMFDQSSREALGQMSQATISIINENNKPNKKVKEHFELLSNSIKKYSIELGLISAFAPLFTF